MMILPALNRLAHCAARRGDVVIAAFMLLAVVMMIIPLPTLLVDALIGINIAFSLLILVVAFYVSHSVDFSALPPIILLSTLFRLSLSITTTRLILLDGDAGQIVQAFGEFVIAGEVVIGLVVFLIITVAQFLVITKGAERVAEVAARFSLDAMPGKQMSIDNDMRNGDLDPVQARMRRSRLERESQLYGAMDGAMKFVKGDAIASLVILFVNLFGGLMIGMVRRDMAFADAVHTYSLLSVGDGLIAQIPALLIALAAGIVVTRVASSEERDLGTEIIGQLSSNAQALALTAGVLLAISFIPGFPAPVFIFIATLLGGSAWLINRRSETARQTQTPEHLCTEPDPLSQAAQWPQDSARVLLRISDDIAAHLSPGEMIPLLEKTRNALASTFGIELPSVGIRVDRQLPAEHFAIDLEAVPVTRGRLPVGYLLVHDDPVHLELLGLEAVRGMALVRQETLWVDEQHRTRLEEARVEIRTLDQVLAAHLQQTLGRHASAFLGIQEARQLLTRMESEYPELVKETLRVTTLQKLAEILRRLLDEGLPLVNLRALLEVFVEHGARDLELHVLSEHVRSAIAPQICHQYADDQHVICACVVSPPLEDAIRHALRRTDSGRTESLPQWLVEAVVDPLRKQFEICSDDLSLVVMSSADLRRYLRQLLMRNELDVPVLAYQDLTLDFSLQSVLSLNLPNGRAQAPVPAQPSLTEVTP
ncbi:type III secretion system export apparatus subunit SctV [Pseudomonas iridis]|uniref:type III secretion system export apparatus subunit SctV n=1 Tax=Pseudomonas iridis TaxID=2710587 RepID=UPI0021C164EE|nr:type III secretion system export apparatus subunit SctV [Pseudomonas iridis]MCT8945771.1 type III secretion system export apparatus subunit SctV [Pseudomonas iridis]